MGLEYPRGLIVYTGPSVLDGAPIVAVVTLASHNRKTGPMAQAWVLRSDLAPNDAVASGADASVCGDCEHRSGSRIGRSCYVVPWQGPLNVYKAMGRGDYATLIPELAARELTGLQLRVTAYGDPAAVPFDVWRKLLARVGGWTGYTSQHRTCDPRFREILMASVGSPAAAREAHEAGWRTYRTRRPEDPLERGEIVCPASDEASHRLTCADCTLCRGQALPGAKSIAIMAHGQRARFFTSRSAHAASLD